MSPTPKKLLNCAQPTSLQLHHLEMPRLNAAFVLKTLHCVNSCVGLAVAISFIPDAFRNGLQLGTPAVLCVGSTLSQRAGPDDRVDTKPFCLCLACLLTCHTIQAVQMELDPFCVHIFVAMDQCIYTTQQILSCQCCRPCGVYWVAVVSIGRLVPTYDGDLHNCSKLSHNNQ